MEPATEPLILANSKFSIDLLKVFCKGNTDNVLFSPLSISSALGLVIFGAKNETASQMFKALHFGEMKIMYHDLYEVFYKGGMDRSLKLVNRMYGERAIHFKDEFLDPCEEWCFASVRNVDFKTNPEAAREKNQQMDKIENLLDQGDVSKDTSLALISAMYFKEQWGKSFAHAVTKDKGVKWPMMYQTNKLPLGNIPHRQHDLTPEARILEIPYENKDLSMLIILPNKSDGLQELVESITYEKLLEWTEPDNMISTEVAVKIPIFKLQEKYNLEVPLKALGMVDLFSDKCDLSGMAYEPLKLSKVVHKSFVEVDEKGIQISVGSDIKVDLLAKKAESPESFVADHPFLFFIRHNPTKSIIFWGRFISP